MSSRFASCARERFEDFACSFDVVRDRTGQKGQSARVYHLASRWCCPVTLGNWREDSPDSLSLPGTS
jgi:hypothetical protein